jgi:hypothetical protein
VVLVNELAVVDQYHYYGFALSRSRLAPVCAEQGGFAAFY